MTSYPPPHHLNQDWDKAFRVVEARPFATLVSGAGEEAYVTQLPLMLQRQKSGDPCLVGHMDKNNPQAPFLSDYPATAIFHGPDCYISPLVYASEQLPTWNYISVHIKGELELVTEPQQVAKSIVDMTERLEGGQAEYRLKSDDPRVKGLLPYIVGFRMLIKEVHGRYKLSQDKSDKDKDLAKQHLKKMAKGGADDLIDSLV